MSETYEFEVHYYWDNYKEISDKFGKYLEDNEIEYIGCDDHNTWDDEEVILFNVTCDTKDEINDIYDYWYELLKKYK